VPLQVFGLYTVILYISVTVGVLNNKGGNTSSADPGSGDLLDGGTVKLVSPSELLLALLGSA